MAAVFISIVLIKHKIANIKGVDCHKQTLLYC